MFIENNWPHTSSLNKHCKRNGATMEKQFAIEFPSAIRTPTWFGDKSIWLTINPPFDAEVNPKAIINVAIADPFALLGKWLKISNATAGTTKPGRNWINITGEIFTSESNHKYFRKSKNSNCKLSYFTPCEVFFMKSVRGSTTWIAPKTRNHIRLRVGMIIVVYARSA